MFTDKDLLQIANKGISTQSVEKQLQNFESGFPFLSLTRAASPGDGITILSPEQIAQAVEYYDQRADKINCVKFVPASGAATRMFKELFEFVNDDKRGEGIDQLIDNIEHFAFWPELKALLPEGADDKTIVSHIITQGLCYGSKPKGLVSFHTYPTGANKAMEEHLVEGAQYASNGSKVKIHFTVSAEHQALFEELIKLRAPLNEELYGVEYDIEFSVQKPSTDTIAVNPDNTPFRTESGELLFRPAGHGALIENLNEIEADVIFIKNIDNVTTAELRADTITYKKALAGVLLDLQHQIKEHINALSSEPNNLESSAKFIEQSLCVNLPEKYSHELLLEILDRPLRICGMVRNEGEPGGGPFWVRNANGSETLQIAESSQISPEDKHLMSEATHFNPVDLVCGVMDSSGCKFDLTEYVDPTTGFISSKSAGGKELRAQELPGLWNGAMANWNTIFVEVPITTFSPVKVIQDLLRKEHQPLK